MIVRENKGFETNSAYPNSDWYNEGNYVVDENSGDLAERIKAAYPFYDMVIIDGRLTNINEYPFVSYTIDKTQISTTEVAVINVPIGTIAIIDDMEYVIDDGSIEYSNENTGEYTIVLKQEGFRDTTISIEVI